MATNGRDADRERYLVDEGDRLLVREVLALTPAERLDTLRVVDAFFARARLVDERHLRSDAVTQRADP